MVEAVKALDNILERMQAHHSKKSALLHHLNIRRPFLTVPQANQGMINRRQAN